MTATDFHGTLYGYTGKRCRCPDCREAKAAYDVDRYDRTPTESYRPPRLVRGGKLCCLICAAPYANHPLSKNCQREAART